MSPLLELAWRGAEGYRGSIARITLLGTIAAVVESATLIAVFAFVADLIGEHTSSGAPSRPSLSGFLSGMPLWAQAGVVFVLATARFALTLRLEWRMSALWTDMRRSMQRKMLEQHLAAHLRYLVQHKGGEHLYHIMEGPSFAAVFYLHLARYSSTGIMMAWLRSSALTALVIKNDPGEGLIWVAFASLISGLALSFYFPRRRIWARLEDDRIGFAMLGDRYVDVPKEPSAPRSTTWPSRPAADRRPGPSVGSVRGTWAQLRSDDGHQHGRQGVVRVAVPEHPVGVGAPAVRMVRRGDRARVLVARPDGDDAQQRKRGADPHPDRAGTACGLRGPCHPAHR